jgi:glucokinase
LLTEADITKTDLAGIGIGVPGLVDPRGKTILRTPNIHLAHFPLAAALKKTFSVPVILGNDVNAGVLAEHWLGAGRGHQNIVGIFVGTGVGGGIILDGKLFAGAQGLAGELGHLTIAPSGPKCGCGNRGCLEALTGRLAIEREIRQGIKRRERTRIKEIAGGKIQSIKSKTLKKALNKKDPLVTRIMRDVAVTLGKACISLRHVFNPELIILGGGVIEACGDFILPIVKKTAGSEPFFAKVDNCTITAAELADDAGVLGAAALIKNYLQH